LFRASSAAGYIDIDDLGRGDALSRVACRDGGVSGGGMAAASRDCSDRPYSSCIVIVVGMVNHRTHNIAAVENGAATVFVTRYMAFGAGCALARRAAGGGEIFCRKTPASHLSSSSGRAAAAPDALSQRYGCASCRRHLHRLFASALWFISEKKKQQRKKTLALAGTSSFLFPRVFCARQALSARAR
jgi:hypothetical protein